MEINYSCSLGTVCQSSNILICNKLKKCSYPFDWIFSNCKNIIHCIENDFEIFLDKSYYVSLPENKCGHKFYNDRMFYHHDPLNNEDHYKYFVRCVNRFRELLKNKEHKLFNMIYINMNEIDVELKNNIIQFNENLSKYTENYTLLVIFHIKNKNSNYHLFTYNDNIHFLELHTISDSTGVVFNNNEDNKYLNDIITKKYINLF